MSKHTPGPWHWVNSETDSPWDGKSYLPNASLRTVAEFGSDKTEVIDGKSYTTFRLPKFILDAEGIGGDDSANANAKLIAAAPEAADALNAKDERIRELEGALRNLIPVAQETCDRWPNDDCFLIPMKRAREALK